MDVTGRVVLATTTANDLINLNINDLSNGIYHVKIKSNNAVEVLKVFTINRTKCVKGLDSAFIRIDQFHCEIFTDIAESAIFL